MSNVSNNLTEIINTGFDDDLIYFRRKNSILSFEVDPWDKMGDDLNFGGRYSKYYVDLDSCEIGEVVDLHRLIYDVGCKTKYARKLISIKNI